MRIWLTTLVCFAPCFAVAEDTTTVTCTVTDSRTKQPIPCRVYVQDQAGKFHFVRSTSQKGSAVVYDKQRFETSFEKHTTVSAHPFQVTVPNGQVTIRIERGKTYLAEEQVIQAAGEPQELTFQLKPFVRMEEYGWYSGDTHVHRSLEELPNLVLAEDLNVALPLTYWVTQAYRQPDRGATAQKIARLGGKAAAGAPEPKPIQVDETHVIYPVNTEYEIFSVDGKRHTLGAVFALGHRTPFDFGVPPVTRFAAEARRQGAILDLDKHSWPWSLMLVPVARVELFELANNHCWRTEFGFRNWTKEMVPEYMRIEMDENGLSEWGWHDFTWKTYYALLNCGFPMKPSAGTASGVHPVPLGFGRVYVHLPDGFSYEAWMKGLAAGRSFVSTGPMLMATFNDRDHGATIKLDGKAKPSCVIEGSVYSGRPLGDIEVVDFGRVVKKISPNSKPLRDGGFLSSFRAEVPVRRSTWLAVRVREDRPDGRVRFAHTAPTYIETDQGKQRPRREEVEYLISRMKQELHRSRGVLNAESLREFQQALEKFQSLR